MKKEIWKNISGYEGRYQISNLGRVKSLLSRKLLKPINDRYLRIHLCDPNKSRKYELASIHRLVAEHFVPNPLGKKNVNHKNGQKKDNRDNNLEWVTPKENMQHASRNSLLSDHRGEKSPVSKLRNQHILEIRSNKKMTQTQIAAMYGVDQSTISNIVNNKTWRYL